MFIQPFQGKKILLWYLYKIILSIFRKKYFKKFNINSVCSLILDLSYLLVLLLILKIFWCLNTFNILSLLLFIFTFYFICNRLSLFFTALFTTFKKLILLPIQIPCYNNISSGLVFWSTVYRNIGHGFLYLI